MPRVPHPATAPARPDAAAPALPVPDPGPDIKAAPGAAAQPMPPAHAARPTALARPTRPDPPVPPQVDTTPPPPIDSALAPDRSPRPPVAARPSPAQPAQVAAGNDSGDTTGPAATQASQGADRATTRRLMAQWGSGVNRAIERRKAYPRGTRASGTARIRLTLTGAGQLTALGLASSSGETDLDRAALAAVRAARYPAAPKALGSGPHSFTVPLSFRP